MAFTEEDKRMGLGGYVDKEDEEEEGEGEDDEVDLNSASEEEEGEYSEGDDEEEEEGEYPCDGALVDPESIADGGKRRTDDGDVECAHQDAGEEHAEHPAVRPAGNFHECESDRMKQQPVASVPASGFGDESKRKVPPVTSPSSGV